MTHFQIQKSGDKFIAEFDGVTEQGDTPIEAIEKAHKAAIKKQEQERIQRAFDKPIEEIEKELPF